MSSASPIRRSWVELRPIASTTTRWDIPATAGVHALAAAAATERDVWWRKLEVPHAFVATGSTSSDNEEGAPDVR